MRFRTVSVTRLRPTQRCSRCFYPFRQAGSIKQPGTAKGIRGIMTAQASVEMHNAVTEEMISARRLWTAVLINAVEDWRNGTLRARREAQTFLFDNDEDFAMVCNNAGLDFSDFRVRLLKIGRRVEARVPFSLCFAT